jgi:hypothetical protein
MAELNNTHEITLRLSVRLKLQINSKSSEIDEYTKAMEQILYSAFSKHKDVFVKEIRLLSYRKEGRKD